MYSFGDSPGIGVSSTAEDITVKFMPASRKISARRGEEESRISFIVRIKLRRTPDIRRTRFAAYLKFRRPWRYFQQHQEWRARDSQHSPLSGPIRHERSAPAPNLASGGRL